MTYSCIEKLEGKYYAVKSLNSTDSQLSDPGAAVQNSYLSADPVEAKIMISMTLTFIAGLIQVINK